MGHKCFISFKMEDEWYKKEIQKMDIDWIDKSLDKSINSNDPDTVLETIRRDHLSISTVTIHIIGNHSAENKGEDEQEYIKRELQASLYHSSPNNTRSGILGVVIPEAYNKIFKGSYSCKCGNTVGSVIIDDSTVVKEFSQNYYIPEGNKCHWGENERFCVLVKWDDFKESPEKYINEAFDKRELSIANKVKVYPK